MQQEEAEKVRRIQRISVTNLFGVFNHSIPLKMEDRITIIRGPNGFGKTMMLKLLNALFSTNNNILLEIPFDEFRVDFADNTSFWVSKSSVSQDLAEEEQSFKPELAFHATEGEVFLLHSSRFQRINTIEDLESFSSTIIQTNPEMVRPKALMRKILSSLEDTSERSTTWLLDLPNTSKTKMPEWLANMRKSVPIRLIETQRLLNTTKSSKANERKTTLEYTVTEDSAHLVEVISKKLAESGTLSQSLDSTFPARVIRPTASQSQVTESELLDKLENLKKKRSQLMTIGLLNQETETGLPIRPEQEINPNTKAVLAVYAEDTEQKLGIFDELAQKIDLLKNIINSRFLYKRMTIDREQGLVLTTMNGSDLALESLSSGEQHELVLFYELLFRVTPGSLILIDEPELSLHLVWQEQFLKDVQQVTQLTNIDIVLATHSPDIISNRRDLEVVLEGPENGRP